VTYVLDASALLRFIDDEAGAQRVSEVIQSHTQGRDRVVMSALHWGEVIGVFYKRRGQPGADRISARLQALQIEPIAASPDRAARSAVIKATRKIPYVDSFAVGLAGDSSRHRLITADFDFKPAEHDISIEFLPTKPKK